MCGIVGQYNANGRPVERQRLLRAASKLEHRGPDGLGQYVEANLGLAMRRLAIIDPEGGDQPKYSSDGKVAVVFNGEIYNHETLREELKSYGLGFKTDSDTEVIAQAYEHWGEGFVERLNGMFAIAVWDGRKKELHLYRDRIGIKPLYYASHPGQLSFASELDALTVLQGGAMIQQEALAQYLLYGSVPATLSIYQGVRKLAAGTRLAVDARGSRVHRYWSPDHFRPDERPVSEAEAVEGFGELFDDSVRLRWRSDVPVGLLLSSGLDSTAVAVASAQRAGAGAYAFTVSMGKLAGDEANVAAANAAKLGLKHETLGLEKEEIVAETLEIMARFDEPFHNASAVPAFAISRLARNRVKAALSGDGGDELLMGYPRYLTDRLGRPFPSSIRPMAGWLGGAMSPYLPGAFFFSRRSLPPLAYLIESAYARVPLPLRNKLMPNADYEPYGLAQRVLERRSPFDPDFVNRFDWGFYLPEEGLTKVDRMSMAVGLEMRVPMLDHRLAEYCLKLPVAAKMPGGNLKKILKVRLGRTMGEEFVQRKKQGFGFDVAQWVRGPLAPEIRQRIADPAFADAMGFERAPLEKIADRFVSNRRLTISAWTLACLASWWDRRKESIG